MTKWVTKQEVREFLPVILLTFCIGLLLWVLSINSDLQVVLDECVLQVTEQR